MFAHTIAKAEPHPLAAPFTLDRFRSGRLIDEAAAARSRTERLMLLIDCPYCGTARPEIEFAYGGEAHIARPPDPSAVSDEEWANFLYFRSNPKDVLAERWRHAFGCGRFFNCLRDTVSDRILAVYKAGESPPEAAAQGAGPGA